jgi:hypothetical protein
MPRNSDYTKHTSYSPRQRLPVSPAKAWTSKLKIGGSDDNGRCSTLKQDGRAYENSKTWNDVVFRDTGGE